jgi:hypothetical protein
MRRFLRYLRIAFSATCLVACVLLVVLWVRSYWWTDWFHIQTRTGLIQLQSMRGRLKCTVSTPSPQKMSHPWAFSHYWIGNRPSQVMATWDADTPFWALVRYDPAFKTPTHVSTIPTWFAVLLSASLAIATSAWIRHLRWRFSLRTLLIATTLVAAVLGLIVWATRQ